MRRQLQPDSHRNRMRKPIHITSATLWLLTLALAPLLPAQPSAKIDDTKAQLAIETLGGRVIRLSDAPGMPITSVDFTKTKVTDADLTLLAGLKSLQQLNLH